MSSNRRPVERAINSEGDRIAGAEDPTAGVIGLRAWTEAGDATGALHGKRRPWHWLPGGMEQQIPCRRDGHSTAHGGTVSPDRPDEAEAAIRAAGLSYEEAEVFRGRAAGETHAQMAARLKLSGRQVERRQASGDRKLREARAVAL